MRAVILIIGFLIATKLLFAQVNIDIPQPYGENFIESELIESVSILPLDIEKYGLITADMEMKVDGNDYFILDNKKTQCVYHFNAEGKLVNTICIEKEKADENLPDLNNPAWYSLNPYKKHIELYRFENSTIYRHNYDGELVGKTRLESTPSDFIRDKNGLYWLYTGWNNSETQFRLIKANEAGNVVSRELRLVTKCTPTEGFSFFANPQRILFWEILNNEVYAIEGNSIKTLYQFNFGSHNLPRDYHTSRQEESFTIINQNGYYGIKKVIENENFTYFFLNYTSMEQREMFHVLHNKKSNEVKVYTENSSIAAFDKAQYLTNDNELIFLVSPRQVRRLLSSGTDFIPASFADLTDEISNYRNPVLLKIKISDSLQQNEAPAEDYYFDESGGGDNEYFD
ncbi:MAG: 6-bladed beta-propeller [Prolixibacteraceae bacterium]|nr:6-bladed beta-propeller [Prolixibacteraceae bacterium]MBN2648635.1 6-bladed beta-propeller [Prolixibacteraceae bacterium]